MLFGQLPLKFSLFSQLPVKFYKTCPECEMSATAHVLAVWHVRPSDEADIEQQRRREAARLYRDRHHVSNDDTISNFEDLSVFGGSLDTIEQVSAQHTVV